MSGRIILLGTVLVEGSRVSAYQTENKQIKWFDENSHVHVADAIIGKTFKGKNPTRSRRTTA
jgi:hypothetical protein